MRIALVAPLLALLVATAYARCHEDQKGSTVNSPYTSVTKFHVPLHSGTNYVDLTTQTYPCNSKNTMPGSPRHVGTLLRACVAGTQLVHLLDLDHGRVTVGAVPPGARATAYVYCQINSSTQ